MFKFQIFIFVFFGAVCTALAQPPARLREADNKSATTNTSKSKSPQRVSYRDFPTAQPMPSDAVWRRDIYRTIDLTKDENAPLYYPITPTKEHQNLFVYIFRLLLRGQIKAYEYTRDANEHFEDANAVKAKKIMDDRGIFYESKDGKMKVNDIDLPSEEVKLYFLKESVFYDQNTASFRTQVTALCPVIVSNTNDFGENEMMRIPMFWVKYEDLAPYLAKLKLMGSNLNNAAEISADDYFNTNRYRGEIYKTTNMQDRIIAQYATTDSARSQESARIEGEIQKFEARLWRGTTLSKQAVNAKTDTLVAVADNDDVTRTSRRGETKQKKSKPTQKAEKASSPKLSTPKTSTSGATFSVRRQRR